MRDFDKQLERYGDELKNVRCPYSDAELDREIRSVVWNEKIIPNEHQSRVTHTKWLWPSVAAAACLVAVLIPLNMPTRANDSIASVDINGEHLYYACNNGCSPEGTLETFKSIIK
jgi:hypothetical protein